MTADKKYIVVKGNLLILGLGSIGKGVLPLILRHIDIDPQRVTVVAPHSDDDDLCTECGVRFIEKE